MVENQRPRTEAQIREQLRQGAAMMGARKRVETTLDGLVNMLDDAKNVDPEHPYWHTEQGQEKPR